MTRYNLFNAIAVNATPARGYSTGDAMEAVEEIAAKKLPANYSYEWTGMSLEESQSGGQTSLIFLLSLILVFFLLAAQYESFVLPFAVLFSVPIGFLGVFLGVKVAELQNNIYVQVGMITLVGLLAKNAILVVEYALQQRKAGIPIVESAITAMRLRLRPIIMTSLAFIAGLIPLMWTIGPSAIGNRSVSFATAGGMVSGVVLGIFFIPVLFVVFQHAHEWVSGKVKYGNQ